MRVDESVALSDRTDDLPGIGRPAAPSTARRGWPRSRLLIAAVLGLMVISGVAHLWALNRDLPLHDTDEEWFVEPAAGIAATGDLNPHWVGHPGSTVIYPLALLIHGWDAIAHGGPWFASNPDLLARFDQRPTSFYVLGRLWTIALAVGTLPLLFLLARRAFDRRVALIATVLLALLPYPVSFGRTVRTESAATFFGLLALWCCVRLWDERRARWCVLAGASVGLAVSSRYFMLALVPGLLVAAAWPLRAELSRAVRATAIAAVSMVLAFVLTTPYFFLDWESTTRSLRQQNTTQPSGVAFSRLGNARWYIGNALPASLTWALWALALGGALLVIRWRRPKQLLLAGFCAVYLIGIAASKQHWQRYLIEMLPVLLAFAAAVVDRVSRLLAARLPPAWPSALAVPVVLTAALVAGPAVNLVELDREQARPTVRKVARDWITRNVASGSRIIQPQLLFGVRAWTIPPLGNGVGVDHDLDPGTRTVDDYRDGGHDFAVVAAGEVFRSMSGAERSPQEATFYRDLACTTRLVAEFTSANNRWPSFRIYSLREPPVRLLNYVCAQPVPREPG